MGHRHRRGPGLSPSEAADLLDLPESVIRQMIASGELPSRRFGRLLRIPEQSVTDLLREFGKPKRRGKETER